MDFNFKKQGNKTINHSFKTKNVYHFSIPVVQSYSTALEILLTLLLLIFNFWFNEKVCRNLK